MPIFQKLSLFLLRAGLGWFFFYAGIKQVLNPQFSAAGYLKGAKTFAGFYQWLASPDILPYINFTNKWALTLLGVALVFGVAVRLSSVLGAALMLLYYFVILDFPHPNAFTYIVDEHIIYALVLLYFAVARVGRVWGLDKYLNQPYLG